MLRLANSICWLASPDVTMDISKNTRGCGQPTWGVVSGLLKATSPGATPTSPDWLLMHLDGAGQFKFFASSLRGTGRALGDRVCGLKADVE